ncbi:MAG: hypothetical protein KDB22_16195 [Planctomycetales bacterium]|nr:hypothetical protein [Planctomycetales bacterium]
MQSPKSSGKARPAIRLFALVWFVALAIDVSPGQFAWCVAAKRWLSPVLNRIGLWQGEWPLFAPDPILNNAWLSADLYAPDSTLQTWNSTYWGTEGTWDKFYRFRHMNYDIRIAFAKKPVIEDFADFVARQMIGPSARPVQLAGSSTTQTEAKTWTLNLYRNVLNLSLPQDGTLPRPEEATWISSSQLLVTRSYSID